MRLFFAIRCYIKILFSKNFAEEVKNAISVEITEKAGSKATQLLAILQREGRFVDFINENIDDFSDEQVGAAVRNIHAGCKKTLAEYFEIEPIMAAKENSTVTIEKGFEPLEIQLIGDFSGVPPFKGTLKHHGWKVVNEKLPDISTSSNIISAAEIEII